MSVPAALAALAEEWGTASEELSEADLTTIVRAGDRSGDDPAAAAAEIADVVLLGLSLGPPARQALIDGSRFTSGRAVEPGTLAALGLAASASLAAREADSRILRVPMLPWDEMRRRGHRSRDLIRLSPRDGADRTPAFQFDDTGSPLPVVVEINRLLDAHGDPWGVADWWLGANAWLRDAPAVLLGRIDDDELLLAARAELAVG